MNPQPFKRVAAGDPLEIAAAAWNAILELRGEMLRGRAQRDWRPGPIEINVRNTTANPITDRNGILGLSAPTTLQTEDDAEWASADALDGVAPTATSTFAVLQEPVSAGAVTRGRLLGLTRCKVNIVTAGDRWAAPTTATDKLTSQKSFGPAYIIHPASGVNGDQWCTVLLLGGVNVKAKWIKFTLASALTTGTASVANCTVNSYWGGFDPGATVTVYNLEASANYIFSGATGHKGIATYDDVTDHYVIVNLECP